jgi:glycosyltransferase involved in cell wall biosynthesis
LTAGPLRILHFVSPASVGGLERVVHALAIGHRARGHDVRVAAMLGRGDDGAAFLDPLRAGGVAIETLEVGLSNVLTERRFVAELCHRHTPQIAHTHGYRPDILDGSVARKCGVPTLSTEHGMSKMGGRTAVYEWLQMRSLRHYDAVVAVSSPIAEKLAQHGVEPDRIHTIPNAWGGHVEFLDRKEARRALDLPEEGPVIGWMGRLIGAKGGDVFLDALARMQYTNVPVSLVGGGPEREALEAQAEELGLRERIQFHGEIVDSARFFRAFDAFVLSSRTEGTPIVLFEAIAAGVPVVATSVGGVPDVVGDHEAILVPSVDPDALSVAIDRVLSKPDAATKRAEAAVTALAERYGLDPWLDRYLAVYRALVR